jgi:AcrR family transcriptional regulator
VARRAMTRAKARAPLSREAVLRAAIEIADRDGIDAVTMRRLGEQLGVEAMSLYHHVRGKDDVVTGMVDTLIGGIPLPPPASSWKATIRDRAMAARAHLAPHEWARALIGTRRGPSAATLRHIDWVVGVLRDGGLAPALVHSAVHLLGSRMFGFTDEAFSEAPRPEEAKTLNALVRSGDYPALTSAMKGVHHDDETEFAFGLDLILDGLERSARAKTRR